MKIENEIAWHKVWNIFPIKLLRNIKKYCHMVKSYLVERSQKKVFPNNASKCWHKATDCLQKNFLHDLIQHEIGKFSASFRSVNEKLCVWAFNTTHFHYRANGERNPIKYWFIEKADDMEETFRQNKLVYHVLNLRLFANTMISKERNFIKASARKLQVLWG